ncbi:MAG: Sugar kinase, ribokinase [Candidatus Kaiserbacteria bacterium GW2011_GWC2_52_8b]|uniref:Sugar kinase, ribokinase n=1 Tax=Candidatus Kaiserbacteria bacterium GW2011_GWC2_52_8b TaxID=1618676 RepID=A0A0G2AES4_9BACT|nr:MAG: Sugar kinase, ribokinase [Candidatus Kaiserbacteria bacterium GW2011_GWC2_52_8b]
MPQFLRRRHFHGGGTTCYNCTHVTHSRIRLARVRPDHELRRSSFQVEDLSVEFGGTAGNIAYNLALLGEHPDIIATAGNDFARYKSHLLLAGIEATTVRFVENDMTSSAYVFTDREDNQIAAFHAGAGAQPYNSPVGIDGRAFAIVAPGCTEDMATLPQSYRRQNFKYFFDPGQQTTALSPEALKNGISGAQILFASDYELGLIAMKTGWTEDVIMDNVPTLVVTFGAQGSRIRTRTGDAKVSAATPAKVVDPTGAGDAYRAGFMKGILAGFSLEACAKLGSVIASYVVEVHGTQNHKFTMEEVKQRHQQSYKEELKL